MPLASLVCRSVGCAYIHHLKLQGKIDRDCYCSKRSKWPNATRLSSPSIPCFLTIQAMYDKARVPEDCVEILTAVKMIIKLYSGGLSLTYSPTHSLTHSLTHNPNQLWKNACMRKASSLPYPAGWVVDSLGCCLVVRSVVLLVVLSVVCLVGW